MSGLTDCNSVDKPIASRLTVQDQPEVPNSTAQELYPVYRGMIGSLLYLASWTRPDMAFAVSELSRFVSNPGKPHLEAANRVFRYLKKTLSLGLVYRSSPSEMPPNTLWGYVDSDWADFGLCVHAQRCCHLMALQASANCGFVLSRSRVHFCLRHGSGGELFSQILG